MKKKFKLFNKKNEKKPFEKRMMDVGRIPNILTGLCLALYNFYFSGLYASNLGTKGNLIFFGIVLILVITMQFIIAPNTNHFITGRLSRRLDQTEKEWLEEEELRRKLRLSKTTENKDDIDRKKILARISEIVTERTELVKELMHCPLKICIQVMTVLAIALTIFICIVPGVYSVNSGTMLFIISGCILGCYYGGLFSFNYAERLCSEYAVSLTEKGVDPETIHEDKFYGMRMWNRILFVIIITYAMTTTIQFCFMWMGASIHQLESKQILNMTLVTTLNTVFTCMLSRFLYKQVTSTTVRLNNTIEKFFTESYQDDLLIPIDLSSEMSYNLHLVNDIITYLQKTSSKANNAAIGIRQQISELAATAEEVSKNSDNLSSIIEKSNETMTQNVKNQLEQISTHIKQVSRTAGLTKKSVDEGFILLTEDVEKISEITKANVDTIAGIKNLSDKIDDVWETIRKIDSLAEKTRIIAFNAELEATAAGERGENFHIVANEIRRLADTITDSTYEIKEKIKNIQHSSDNLIVTSEGGTQQIREGSEFFSKMEEKFKELKLKSDITAEYANEIQNIIATQDTSFVQINATLTQINSGFYDFAKSTKTLTDSAEALKDIAGRLNADYVKKMEES